jgi:hypothetical protein
MELRTHKGDIQLFEENRMLRGYSVHVLDDWGAKIKKRFITEKEKQQYIEEFGEKMITDTEFFEWWCKIHNLKKKSTE